MYKKYIKEQYCSVRDDFVYLFTSTIYGLLCTLFLFRQKHFYNLNYILIELKQMQMAQTSRKIYRKYLYRLG